MSFEATQEDTIHIIFLNSTVIRTHRQKNTDCQFFQSFLADLNGLYQPKNAAKICEADPACGGFTFKGTPASSGPLSKMKYLTNFFHFFPAEHFGKKRKPKKQFFHWTSYRVGSRNFVKLPNSYQKIETSTYEAVCLAKK